jgi:hypothetical protein
VTLPVGAGPPENPATVTVTLSASPVPIFEKAGVTATAGVATVTETVAVPDAVVYADELAVSGVYPAVRVFEPLASDPDGTVMVALPLCNAVVAEL